MWPQTDSLNKLRLGLRLQEFFNDFQLVFRALRLWSVPFVFIQMVLGLFPIITVLILGKIIDGLVIARGIGVMTLDLNRPLYYALAVMLLTFVCYLLSLRFNGKAALVGRDLRAMITFGSLLTLLLVVGQVLTTLVYCLMLMLTLAMADRRWRMLGLVILILISILSIYKVLGFTVLRAFTMGEGLAISGAVIMLLINFKMRLAKAF